MSGRILVTGAGGYIGSAIVTHLAEKNLKVRAFGHDTRFAELSRLASGDVDFHPGELLDADSLAGALDGVEAVVHTASFRALYTSTIVLYTCVFCGASTRASSKHSDACSKLSSSRKSINAHALP